MRRRSLLNYLLMTSLQGTVTIPQINRVLELISQHLDLNVPRILKEFFQIYRRISESYLRLLLCHIHGIDQGCLSVHDPHTTATSTARSFDNDRIAYVARDTYDLFWIIRKSSFTSGHHRNTCFNHGDFRTDLITHQSDSLRFWADKYKPTLFNTLSKISILR